MYLAQPFWDWGISRLTRKLVLGLGTLLLIMLFVTDGAVSAYAGLGDYISVGKMVDFIARWLINIAVIIMLVCFAILWYLLLPEQPNSGEKEPEYLTNQVNCVRLMSSGSFSP